MNKATNAEVDIRVKDIYEKLCSGWTYTDIVAYCIQKYTLKRAQATKYIKKATTRIVKNNKKEIETIRAEAITRYSNWMKELLEKDDIKGAAKMQKRIDKISGLEVENINVSGEISIKDLERLLSVWIGNSPNSKAEIGNRDNIQ